MKNQQVSTYPSERENFSWEDSLAIVDEKQRLIALMECLDLEGKCEKYEKYLELLKESSSLDWSEKYYLLWQIVARLFSNTEMGSKNTTSMLYQVYDMVEREFIAEFPVLNRVYDRNQQLVIVTVQQFIGLLHAPTKITLDRARVLRRMGKEVLIVNTAEYMGGTNIGLHHPRKASYLHELLSVEKLEYEGDIFPYIQFANNMPNVQDVQGFLEIIEECKPAYIVNIGGDSLLLDACSRLVPVLNVNTVASEIARTKATAQVIGRKVEEQEREFLRLLGKSADEVIVGRFTLALPEQTHHYTREELGIPKERFVITVVGTRLTFEISQTFIEMIDKALEYGAFLVVIGEMRNYDAICVKDAIFKENSVYLGMREDILADLELCDLYVNPDRKGGGTSGVAALYKGCPVVTLHNGDVALGVGEEFCVGSYEEMQKQILYYMTDREFYKQMSRKARERAEYMLDSESAFAEIIDTFEREFVKRFS